MEDIKFLLGVWKWPLILAALVTASVFVSIAMASSGGLLAIPICIGVALVGLGVYPTYCSIAHTWVWNYKNQGSEDYKKKLRQLKKLVRQKRNASFGYQGYSSGSIYYAELIEAERDLAKHMDIDYDEPARKPRTRW